MTLDEALKRAGHDYADQAYRVLAAEVRRLQAEVTALRLFAPSQRAGKMPAPVQIAPTQWAAWGIVGMVQETDEEWAARAGRQITEDVG